MRNALVIATLFALAACSGEQDQSGQADTPAGTTAAKSLYQAEIAPLLQANCATCHLTGAEAGNLSLIPDKAIASLVGAQAIGAPGQIRVVPGEPDKSYLLMKLEGTHTAVGGTGARMPFGAPPLAPEQVAKIRQWIAEGAKP
ncbi:MAG: hypothetical protein WCY11_11105 [Novosphingobium sp.]